MVVARRPKRTPRGLGSPVVLRSLHVENVRGLGDLELQFAAPPRDEGQCIVLLGPNGAGKTTLLRSLVLALRNLADPKIWPGGAFSTPWISVDGGGEARISVRLADDGKHTTRIRLNGSETFHQTPRQVTPGVFPLFAYGCRRGSAVGGVARAVDLGDDDGPEVATLFNESARLIHAETWLVPWLGDALENAQARRVYAAICRALQLLLDVESVEVKNQRFWVTERSGRTIGIGALSDGYLTTAGWFIDLIARWIELARRRKIHVGDDFLERMTGLVLLDEIDLHLHPRWQIEAISRARKLLPRMSFVITTHNPLTLVGAKPEEIWILSLDGKRVRAEQCAETPMLLTGGQIYSRYFGIHDIYPDGLGRKLSRYGFLSGYALRNDAEEAEMVTLRGALHAAGIDPGWEEVPREPLPPFDLPPGASSKSKKAPSKLKSPSERAGSNPSSRSKSPLKRARGKAS